MVEARGHFDPPAGAVDSGHAGRWVSQRSEQRGGSAILITQEHARLEVNAGRRQRTTDLDPIRVAQEVLRERHHVDAEVEHGAATKIKIEQPVAWIERPVHSKVRIDLADLADGAVGDQLAGCDDRRLEAGPYGLHHKNLLGPGSSYDLLRPGNRCREALFD